MKLNQIFRVDEIKLVLKTRGLKGNQRGNQSSLTEFKGGLGKIDFQWREGRDGWGGGGGRGIIGILQNVMEGIR